MLVSLTDPTCPAVVVLLCADRRYGWQQRQPSTMSRYGTPAELTPENRLERRTQVKMSVECGKKKKITGNED